MDNGTITMKDYKKITDNSKLSASGLANAIKKLKPKSVKVEAKTDGKEDVDNLKTSVDNTKGKTVTVQAKTLGINSIGDLSIAMKTLKNKYISVNLNPKLRKDWFKLVQKQLQARTFTLNAKTTVIKSKGKEVEKVVKSQTGAKFSGEKFKTLMNKVGTTQDQWGRVVIPETKKAQMSKKWKTLIEFLKKNGIATNNPIVFAKGGFPEDGWFRASKGEYFGQFDDGTSYIANNRQIENGIAAEIAPAVHAAVKAGIREVFSEMPMQSGGDVYLDGVKVTKEVMSTAKKISKSTGVSWKMA